MASPRRIGAPDAKNRIALMDAAEQLMLEEGYAAVTSRRVASKAGLKPQLVHYYFRTMEDMFLSLFRRRGEEGLKWQEEALASDRPLHALWRYSTETSSTRFTMEFIGLATHYKSIKDEIARYAERFRLAQMEAVPDLARCYGISEEECTAGALMVMMTGVSRVLVMEETLLGMSLGHAETRAFVEHWLERLESAPAKPTPKSGSSAPTAR